MQDSPPSTQQDSWTETFETVFLVVVESLLTVLLRFDSQLRQRAYPLVVGGTLIAVRSYLPHDEIYVTFTFKGVLLDSQIPAHKERADVVVNAHSFEIINAIFSDREQTVDKLQFRGDAEQVALFKSFLQELSINSLIASLLSRLGKQGKGKQGKGKRKKQSTKPSTNAHKDEINQGSESTQKLKTDYKAKYRELKEKHHQSDIEYKRLKTEVSELKSRQNFFSTLAVLGLVFGLIIGYLVG